MTSVELDGIPADPAAIPLADDGGVHRVTVLLGEQGPGEAEALVGKAQQGSPAPESGGA